MDTSAASPADTSSSAFQPQRHQYEFHGSGGEYFRIWIVNLLLTIVTLGIYGAWAKVRRLRYFYGNTVLAGSSFEYHGQPIKILKGRLIAVALIAPYYIFQRSVPVISAVFALLFLIALPFIIVQSRRFQMRMSSWRNVHFGFDGHYGPAARIFIGLSILIPFTLGIIFPYVQWRKQSFVIGESRFGNTRFEFDAKSGPYYRAYFAAFGWWLLSLLGGLILLGLCAALIFMLSGNSLSIFFNNPRSVLTNPSLLIWVSIYFVAMYAVLIAIMLVPGAVAHARITNEAFNHTRIGGHQLQSNLLAKKLVGLYLSNLLLTVITLGLFSPWAKVRLLRYQMENTALLATSNLDEFVATETDLPSATGEELGDFLDLDFGL